MIAPAIKSSALLLLLIAMRPAVVDAQSFSDYGAYCKAMGDVARPTLMARAQGMSKAQLKDNMRGMTDPTVEALRSELVSLCVAKKVFVQ